jgi:hypothetical protein
MKYVIFVFIALVLLASCSKDLSQEGPIAVIPVVPPDTLVTPPDIPDTPVTPPPVKPQLKFQLKAFYSDVPIDFDDKDGSTVKETDLWAYVQDYIKDDIDVLLEDGTVEVHQNQKKMPGVPDDVLIRQYSFGSDEGGDYMKFLSPTYEEVKYRLYEKTDDHFVIGLKWKSGAHVFSRFERVP